MIEMSILEYLHECPILYNRKQTLILKGFFYGFRCYVLSYGSK